MGYKIAVSSGWWGIAKDPNLLGLGTKISSIATYGVRFVQADIEHVAEFVEPSLINQIKAAIDKLGIEWGAHGEIGENIAWETAIGEYWKQSHRRLHQYLDTLYDFFIKGKNERYKPLYINFHASNMLPLGYIIERYRAVPLVAVDINGNPDWDEFFRSNEKVKEWFKKTILRIFVPDEELVKIIEAAYEDVQNKLNRLSKEEKTKFEEKLKKEVEKGKYDEDRYRIWREKTKRLAGRYPGYGKGTIDREELAYLIIARYIYEKRNDPKEPVWKLFFGNKSWEEVEKSYGKIEENGKKKDYKFFDEETFRIRIPKELEAAVAIRYILGHFDKEPTNEYLLELKKKKGKEWDKFYELPAYKKLEILKVYFAFEPPETIGATYEGLQRILKPLHIYYLVKALQTRCPYFKVIVDFEHLLHNGLNVEDELKQVPEDFGKEVIGVHVGALKPYHPAHYPIELGSGDQPTVYKYIWILRNLGFKDGLIIFERGGKPGASPLEFMKTTVLALRKIVEYLEKDVSPEKLPPEFYGISSKEIMAIERQLANIRLHALDPLKGLIMFPEEEHGELGKKAVEKGKAKEWKAGELR